MKSVTLFLGMCFIFGLGSCNNEDFKKLKDSEVNKDNVKIAQNFATDYLTQLKNGSFYTFQDEAIDVLKNQLTEQNQKKIYQQLKDKFGDFEGLEYAEVWFQNSNALHIIRFKSNFANYNKKLEIRVVLDESNKITGFWIKPWSDILK